MPQRARQPSLPGIVSRSKKACAAKGLFREGSEPTCTDLGGRSVYVVDAPSLIFQVYHALPEMTSLRGESVAAVYGFLRDICYLIEEKRPDYMLCGFDLPGPTFRHELFADYKRNRGAMPEDLVPQFAKIRQVLVAMAVPVLEYSGFEADDILATVARQCDALGGRCFLVTGDKDCRQLITERVSLYNIRKDQVYDAHSLAKDWGIRPDQVVDFQALVGDAVDNVPGVPLIGPKIARQLLESYETMDQVLQHAEEVSGAQRRKNLSQGREVAQMSRQLVELDGSVPIQIHWNAAQVGGFDADRLTELVIDFGFHTLRTRLDRLTGGRQHSWSADYQRIDTPEALAALVETLSRQEWISVDTETTSLSPRWAEIVGYSFSWQPGQAYYLPVKAPGGEVCLDPQTTRDALKPILEDPSIKKVGQDLKYDMVVLRRVGIQLQGLCFDTMVASYLLNAGERNHSLEELSQRYLDHTPTKITELIGRGKKQKRMDEVPVSEVTHYAAEDADLPLRLLPILRSQLKESQLNFLYDTVEVPLVEVLAEMEFLGIRVDVDRLSVLSRQYGRRLQTLETEIYELAGRKFNIASPKQLAQILFGERGLPVVKKTKTGPSTDAEVLEQLAAVDLLPEKIVAYRQFAKLKNTYVDALPGMVHPETGRVHASFNQGVAATGRLSSSDPNLQNIPVRLAAGREIREAFIAGPENWKLLSADYSQIELRVLAHFSRDETLCQAFSRAEDIHTGVASQIYGVGLSEVTSEMRRHAKAVNFGVIYGQSPFGLAKSLGIPQEQAAEFIENYFLRYPGVDSFLRKTLVDCRQKGYVETVLGRRRAIRGVREGALRAVNLPERTAVNTVVQGSAADLIKLAMIAVERRLRRERLAARMLLQIHDELVFEVPSSELENLGNLVVEEMSEVLKLEVPLSVDLKSGRNWAECEPWS